MSEVVRFVHRIVHRRTGPEIMLYSPELVLERRVKNQDRAVVRSQVRRRLAHGRQRR